MRLKPFFVGKISRDNSVLSRSPPKNKLKRCLESNKKLRSEGLSRRDGNRRKLKKEKNLERKLQRKLLPLNRIGNGERLKTRNVGKTRSVLN